jgi:hypothetical protein
MLEAVGTRVEKEELLSKCENHELNAVGVEQWSPLAKKLLKALPYTLTASQLDAVKEIIWDLRRPVPMNRLLQVIICILLGLLTNFVVLVSGLLYHYISLKRLGILYLKHRQEIIVTAPWLLYL